MVSAMGAVSKMHDKPWPKKESVPFPLSLLGDLRPSAGSAQGRARVQIFVIFFFFFFLLVASVDVRSFRAWIHDHVLAPCHQVKISIMGVGEQPQDNPFVKVHRSTQTMFGCLR